MRISTLIVVLGLSLGSSVQAAPAGKAQMIFIASVAHPENIALRDVLPLGLGRFPAAKLKEANLGLQQAARALTARQGMQVMVLGNPKSLVLFPADITRIPKVARVLPQASMTGLGGNPRLLELGARAVQQVEDALMRGDYPWAFQALSRAFDCKGPPVVSSLDDSGVPMVRRPRS